ncbi:B-cell linker protein isoform X2 [Syngnathoides biaculeatus]|uniref:B-cell linker protein isoform X2 n=1 Tax=Syngnathoides biaculeatus TaxID=300417 RepID=UPI002ADE43EC|nr:B-cell linker protein isoform X2 [Syngnathoides biaculeatus]
MDILGKFSASATAKIRQLQKITQDIQKNDDSYLNKLKRLKSKPAPEVPVRDYRDEVMVDMEDFSGMEYDHDTYDNALQEHDINYEPPPCCKVFTRTPSSSFLTGDYLDSCLNERNLEHRKAFKWGKESRQLPSEPSHVNSNEEDYINPDGSNEDSNYVEPAENFAPRPVVLPRTPSLPFPQPLHAGLLGGSHEVHRPTERQNLYEVTKKEDTMLRHVSANRAKMGRSCDTDQQAESDSRYEVWNHDNKQPPPFPPKPLPRGSPNSPFKLAQDVKQRDCDRQTHPMTSPDLNSHPPKSFTLDKQTKIPLPNVTFSKRTSSESVENGATDQDKDADVYGKPWFAGECDRKTADQLLFHANKDGAFMVRKSSGQDTNQPYTLVVYNKGRVYNIPVRYIHTRQQYALGREKKGEEFFHSISQIIKNHQKNPLVLIDSKSNSKDAAHLRFPMKQPTTSGHQGHSLDAFSPRCNAHMVNLWH